MAGAEARGRGRGALSRFVRTALVLCGLVIIYGLSAAFDLAMMAIFNGRLTMDPDIYFEIRNQSAALVTKLFCDLGIAFLAGYWVARLEGHQPIRTAAMLALGQTLALAWTVLGTVQGSQAPAWLWTLLIIGTAPAILLGAGLAARRI